jgi:electron transfer flavoprotein alpha subunit
MVLVIAESAGGQLKKAALEAATYGKKTAELLGTTCQALVLGNVENPAQLGKYGVERVLHDANTAFNQLDSQVFSEAIAQAVQQSGATVLILSHTSTGKSIAGRLSVRLQAGLVSGANAVPVVSDGQLVVSKPVFSGKAYAETAITSKHKIISVMGNAIRPEQSGSEAPVEPISLPATASKLRIKSVKKQEGTVPLPEAEIVVSAGRGMKGPENWHLVEDLASAMNATTACSRPVADSHWRPHHEHVGQTGIAIRPNLYVAIGISGAIQHLAGVNTSKVIVVINKDPEAPFFKAADYGVVGDLFEVVPKLTTAYKEFKAAH